MRLSKLQATAIGITCGAMLCIIPSFMILRRFRVLSKQEIILWVAESIICVIASIYLSGKRQQIPAAIFAYGFFFLYNALSILCAALNYGVIAWTAVSNVGLVLVGCAAIALLMPKISKKYAQAIQFLTITAVLVGVSFVYCTWAPLLAVPGALVLVDVYGYGQTTDR
jgi:hypothetical protein